MLQSSDGHSLVPHPRLLDEFALGDQQAGCFFMRHIDSSSKFRGIWKRECAVLPDGNNNAAIPEAATVSMIFSSDRRALVIAFHRNVFHVPPWPYTNISFCTLHRTALFESLRGISSDRVFHTLFHSCKGSETS
ncbi:hypothetical protein Tco_1034746 [Tanacetum coccineum]